MIQSKYLVKYSGIPTFALKRKKAICLAQSRHQLIESLTWKDVQNRQLFTIFTKLRSRHERYSFKWNCRISVGHIYWRETIQYRFIGSGIEYYAMSQLT